MLLQGVSQIRSGIDSQGGQGSIAEADKLSYAFSIFRKGDIYVYQVQAS